MTARTKIDNLTTSWIGFLLVAGLSSLILSGIGLLSLITTLGSVAINVVLATYLGRRLVARKRGTRTFLLVLNALGVVLGSLGTIMAVWALLHGWSFSLLYMTVLTAAHVVMNFRSWRVLRDQSVRSYFG